MGEKTRAAPTRPGSGSHIAQLGGKQSKNRVGSSNSQAAVIDSLTKNYPQICAAQRKPRVTAEQIAAARCINLIQLVGNVGLQRNGNHFVALCCFHKEKAPSLHVWPDHYHCFGCGAHGDVIEWIQQTRNLSFVEAVKHLAGKQTPQLRLVSKRKTPAPVGTPEVTTARGIWREGRSVIGTAVETHLRQRGISTFPESVRAIENFNWFAHLVLPVMVVAIQGPTGIVIGVQLTALTIGGTRKAFSELSRRSVGIMAAGAARFSSATDTLGLAEGTEKAIAAQELTGIPTWASLGASRMHNVLIPESVKELHIFADDDEPGRAAAEKTAMRHNHRRIIVRYAMARSRSARLRMRFEATGPSPIKRYVR